MGVKGLARRSSERLVARTPKIASRKHRSLGCGWWEKNRTAADASTQIRIDELMLRT